MFQTPILIHNSVTGGTDVKSTYAGRASVDVDLLSGKADLKLSSVTLSDSSIYECGVLVRGDDEGKLADTARLVVLGTVMLDLTLRSSFTGPTLMFSVLQRLRPHLCVSSKVWQSISRTST